MTRRSKGCVYRKTVARNGRTKKAGFYRARYVDAKRDRCDHVLVLSNGQKIRDKAVAEAELDRILKRVEREAAGVIDPTVQAARLAMRVVIARYIRDLRNQRCGRSHVKQTLSYLRWFVVHGKIERLADFRAPSINRALAMLDGENHRKQACRCIRQPPLGKSMASLR